MSEWVLRGDINFTTYGGKLIRRDDDIDEPAYQVLEVFTNWDVGEDLDENYVWAFFYTVYPNDSWIKRADVMYGIGEEPDAEIDDYSYVDAIVGWYGNSEFNPVYYEYDRKVISVKELEEWMRDLGAEAFI